MLPRLRFLPLLLFWLALPSPTSAQDSEEEDNRPGIAVNRFTNGGSYGESPEDLGALEVGLQQMLLTELEQSGSLRIVERREMNAIMAEQALGSSGRVQEGTEARVGMLVGARYMVSGTFVDDAGDFRMDAAIFNTETSEVIETVSVRDERDRMLDLVVELGQAITTNLDLPGLDSTLVAERTGREVPPEAIVMFSWAQLHEDRGDPGLAADTYQRIMQLYPEMDEARDEWLRLRGDWEFGLFLGSLNDQPEFVLDTTSPDDFRRDAIIGVRLGYHLPMGFVVEAELGQSLVTVAAEGGTRQNMNIWPAMASLEWTYHLTHDFQAFAGAGLGAVHFDPDRTAGQTNFAYNLRGGGRLYLTRNHALRFDLRYFLVPDALSKTAEEIGVETRDTLGMLEASVGFSWFPGGG